MSYFPCYFFYPQIAGSLDASTRRILLGEAFRLSSEAHSYRLKEESSTASTIHVEASARAPDPNLTEMYARARDAQTQGNPKHAIELYMQALVADTITAERRGKILNNLGRPSSLFI